MLIHQEKLSCAVCVLALATVAACSSSSSKPTPGNDSGTCIVGSCTSYALGGCGLTTDAAIEATVASCSKAGQPVMGPPDTHCATAADDGGARTQAVSAASCCAGVDAGGGGDQGCPYGQTMFGQEGDDDDCKYHVTWTSSPICEGTAGVQFVATVVYRSRVTASGAPLPLTGANPLVETITATPGDWDAATYCDDMSSHLGPNSALLNHLVEGPPGTYTGNIPFDAPGLWTVRFHVNEECADLAPDSPHGHAAFHVHVP